jgi:hypothetical protein
MANIEIDRVRKRMDKCPHGLFLTDTLYELFIYLLDLRKENDYLAAFGGTGMRVDVYNKRRYVT